MKFFKLDKEPNTYKITPSTIEDLYYLSRIISKNDVVEADSFRRHKSNLATSADSRANSGEKKHVRIKIRCDSVDFAESSNKLRVTGVIISGTPEEFVQVGDFHTLDIEISNQFILTKELDSLDRQMIEDAKKASVAPKALLLMIDEQQANAYSINSRGIKLIFENHNSASKRDPATFESIRNQHYHQILQGLVLQDSPFIIVAGPGFEAETFTKYCKLKDAKTAAKISTIHANSVEKSAVAELIRAGLLEKIMGKQKLQEEFDALEMLKKSLGKSDGMAVYGLSQTALAIENGSVSTLLVLDKFLREDSDVKKLVEKAANQSVRIIIFNSEDDAGYEFSAFLIAGLLRYSTKYAN